MTDSQWARTPIDRFILAKLEEKNLRPVRPADKRALIRRAYFDLIGLPPAPEQVEGTGDQDPTRRIQEAYRLLFQREPGHAEVQRGLEFLKKANALFQDAAADPKAAATPWQQYAQALLSAGEFYYVN